MRIIILHFNDSIKTQTLFVVLDKISSFCDNEITAGGLTFRVMENAEEIGRAIQEGQ